MSDTDRDRLAEADRAAADCCATDPVIARHFDKRIADLTAEAEFPEMVDVSAMLLGLLEPELEASAPSVIELGSGSGALAVALIKRGAARVRGIDMSPGMLAVAVRRAEQAGVADQASFGVGDGATADLDEADWVVLDRVICCYPDMPRLVGNAAGAARSRVAFTVPISRGWKGLLNRVMWFLENIPAFLTRNSCPTFVHDIGRIEEQLARHGFTRLREDRLGLWYGCVWERSAKLAT
jgi:magnesium-protoporphyrin O-methyltransferase